MMKRVNLTWDFSEGLAIVRNGDRHGAVNQKGEEVIPLVYEFMKPYSNGLSATKKETIWGYLNAKGELYLPFTFDDAWSFENGTGQVRVGSEIRGIYK